MLRRLRYPLLIIILVQLTYANAQERGLLLSHYYSANTYQAATQNWGIVQDKRGVLYFANGAGVLEFDGKNWGFIEVGKDASVRSIAIDSNNMVYVGGYGEFGLLSPDKTGLLRYVSLSSHVDSAHKDFNEVWDTRSIADTVFFLTDRCIFSYHKGKISYFPLNEKRVYYLSHLVDSKYAVHILNQGLFFIDGGNLKLIKGSQTFSSLKIHSIIPFNGKHLICTRDSGLYTVDYENGVFKNFSSLSLLSSNAQDIDNYFRNNLFYFGISVNDSLLALSSILGDVIIVDQEFRVVDVIDQSSIGVRSTANFLYYQPSGILWLALNNGIASVELTSPFRYWNEQVGIDGVLSDVARKGNFFYLSTGSGLFYIEKRRHETFKPDRFNRLEGRYEQAWQFLYFQEPTDTTLLKPLWHGSNQNTHLLVAARNGVFEINKRNAKKITQLELPYVLHQGRINRSYLFVGHENGVSRLKYKNGKWYDELLLCKTNRKIVSIGEDSDGNIWFSENLGGVGRIVNAQSEKKKIEISRYDTLNGLPNAAYVRIFDLYDTLLFVVNSKFYSFNYSATKFKPFDIKSLNILEWLPSNNDTLMWRRISNQLLTDQYVTHYYDSISWVSTDKGIFQVRPAKGYNYFNLPAPVIYRVINRDSVLFNGNNFNRFECDTVFEVGLYSKVVDPVIDLGIALPYKRNSMIFSYSWPYFESDEPCQFSYQLVGNDEGWSEWSTDSRKEYTNLREGKYVFKVKARSIFGIESPIAEFHFEVRAPWYRTVYAYIGYAILGILLIYFFVIIWHYKLIRERDKLERLVKERTQEILLQKEELQVQAEHLRETYDWISEKNAMLEKQKSEIEQQKQKLEEINATKNKFFRIIAHDLRNPISTLVNSTAFLLTDIETLSSEKAKKFMGELNRLALTTYGLLENLLDWSSNEMGDIHNKPRKVSLALLVNQNIELVQNRLAEKNINLTIDVPHGIELYVDENMMNTVLRNLISNAVKFTRPGGEISIDASVVNGKCLIRVRDNGIGIPDQNIEKLFRIDKSIVTPGTQNEKGSGLGLLLCKEFVDKMGGSISVQSRLGFGTTFKIEFLVDIL